MPKQLLIMRHAKSSWADSVVTDHARTLNERGQRDVPQMAQWIAAQNCLPALILCSTAVRALETATLFIANCPQSNTPSLILIDELYHAQPQTYSMQLAKFADESIQTAMVVGHNPGLEELILKLSGHYERMSTGSIASLRLQIDHWSDMLLSPHAELLAVWRPKEIL